MSEAKIYLETTIFNFPFGKYDISIISGSGEAERLAAIYLAEGVINRKYSNDALHIAITTVTGLDFIVSLNFQHIVRQKTIQETARINEREGYKQINIYEPSEVINGKNR
jgi:hypothetical protein